MNVLIAVASKHGSTIEIAEVIGDELNAAHIDVDIVDLTNGEVDSVRNYSAVVLGSAVYGASWMPEAKQFAPTHHDELLGLPVWLFSSGPLGDANAKPHNDPAKLALSLGEVKPRDHRVFVGKLDPAQLGPGERLIAKVERKLVGDFRDRQAITDWGKEIARQLRSELAEVQVTA